MVASSDRSSETPIHISPASDIELHLEWKYIYVDILTVCQCFHSLENTSNLIYNNQEFFGVFLNLFTLFGYLNIYTCFVWKRHYFRRMCLCVCGMKRIQRNILRHTYPFPVPIYVSWLVRGRLWTLVAGTVTP